MREQLGCKIVIKSRKLQTAETEGQQGGETLREASE